VKQLYVGALFLLIYLTQCISSPLNRSQVALYSEEEMAFQGNNIYSAIKESTPVSRNSEIVNYVECIAENLIRGLGESTQLKYNWEVTTFEDPQVNAFALPGGKIGVYEGLLEITSNQHQLAAVIAHEIGHVLARHGNERASQAAIRNVGVLAAQVLRVSESTVAAIDTSAQIGLLLPFSRIQETEADKIGLQLMAETGFDPLESLNLWENMADNQARSAAELLSTHPSPQSRIETLQTMMSPAEQTWVDARKSGINPDCIVIN
jgi:predicted Zn-dependent protease